MVIAFISHASPYDRSDNSGTMFTIARELRNMGHEVIWIPIKRNWIYKKLDKLCYYLSKLTGKVYSIEMNPIGLRIETYYVEKELAKLMHYDLLFSCIHSASLYYLKIKKPLIYLSDATFAILNNYYFSGIAPYTLKMGNKVDQRALDKASEIIMSSEWSRKSVIEDYHQDEKKVHVVEFGANMDEKDIIPHQFKYEGHLHLLFIGVDWKRKGGDLAVETTEWLNKNGQPATIHIIGARNLNKKIQDLPYIDYVGFINKNKPEDYQKFISIVQQCHCMLLPTKAECSAIAFCESSAYGLPVFSHQTGGCANYVLEGQNGHLLPPGATSKEFGESIINSLMSGEMEQMSHQCLDLYHKRLCWKAWGQKVKPIIDKYNKNA